MTLVAALRSFLRALVRRSRMERDMDDEMRFHVEARAADLAARGMPRADAERRAREEFGDVVRWKEAGREARGLRAIDELRADVRYGLRSLRRRPLTTVSAIATLAIGIGLNAAVFSVVDWVLLRPLPYPSPEELVRADDLTYSEFDRLSQARALRASTGFSTATRIVSGQQIEPAHVLVTRLMGDFFGTFGVHPELGRGFARTEVSSGAPVVVVSEAFWRNRVGSDAAVIGRTIAIDGQPNTIVGIMPEGRGYPAATDVWRPLTAAEREDDDRELVMIGRLATGVSTARANVELATLVNPPQPSPDRPPTGTRDSTMPWVENVQRLGVRQVRTALTALWASAAFILLMACANVAALVGTRGTDRAGELAVRGALGASRGRLLRQLMTESVLLAAIGGIAGLVLGRWALDLLVALAPAEIPRLAEVALDGRVIVIGMAATLVVGLVVGVAPSVQASRLDLRSLLGITASSRTSGRAGGRCVLAGAQVAIAVVLTVGAGLLGRSLQHLVTIDHGFEPDRLLAVDLYGRGLTGDVRQLYRELIEAAESVSGVHSASVARRLPTQTIGTRVAVRIGRGAVPQRDSAGATLVTVRPVTPRYFETAGITVLGGRVFTPADREGAPHVAIVNEAFVRNVLDHGRAEGTTLMSEVADGPITIVGVVADITPAGERDRAAMYLSMDHVPFVGGSLLIKTDGDPRALIPELTSRIRRVAPALPLDRIGDVAAMLEAGRTVTRFNMRLASAFAGLALVLAAVGVYGLTAGQVSTRWRELAVRLALGASRAEALWTVMRPGAVALAGGVLVGIIGALGAGRWMRALLQGVEPADPPTLVAVPLLLAALGLVAATLAGARVLRADPAATLRRD